MDAISTFLDMGGYGAFVWPAYGLSALILSWLMAASVRTLSSGQATLEALRSATGEGDGETQA